MTVQVLHGDCLEVLRGLEDSSVDAIVTDPPYGLSNTKPAQVTDVLKAWVTGDDNVVPGGKGFMGKSWDGFVPPPAVWKECMRVLKPGGHMAVFAGARTQDLMGLSIRLAGFEIKDTLGWIFGTGFPKSHNISKAIDKAAGAEREVVATEKSPFRMAHPKIGDVYESTQSGDTRKVDGDGYVIREVTAPATPDAAKWDGWGTALKPAIEPIILARKPLVGTVAGNVLAWGVGGLNIDASRVEASDKAKFPAGVVSDTEAVYGGGGGMYSDRPRPVDRNPSGRFPANVLLDEHAAAEMDKQSGVTPGGSFPARRGADKNRAVLGEFKGQDGLMARKTDSGGASRFFPVFKYQAKAPKKERPVIEREDGTKIQHATVKPLALMEWLVTLITPPGGTVLDPFAGSGTTLEAARNKGFSVIGIEREPDYIQLINKRLEVESSTLNS